MSDRKPDQTSYAAKLKAAHLAQIDALTREGLSDDDRILLFTDAAEFGPDDRTSAFFCCWHGNSVAASVWTFGEPPLSLFASMPGCKCPVIEQATRGKKQSRLIPCYVETDWSPTVEVLEEFARIQQEAWLRQP